MLCYVITVRRKGKPPIALREVTSGCYSLSFVFHCPEAYKMKSLRGTWLRTQVAPPPLPIASPSPHAPQSGRHRSPLNTCHPSTSRDFAALVEHVRWRSLSQIESFHGSALGVVTTCSYVSCNQHFGGRYCFHLQGNHRAHKNTAIDP